MTKTTVTPREKLRQWVAKNDLDSMSLEELIRGIIKCGVDYRIRGPGSSSLHVVGLSESWFEGWSSVGGGQTPTKAMRRAIRQAVKE